LYTIRIEGANVSVSVLIVCPGKIVAINLFAFFANAYRDMGITGYG
jgi:hypothetical protein